LHLPFFAVAKLRINLLLPEIDPDGTFSNEILLLSQLPQESANADIRSHDWEAVPTFQAAVRVQRRLAEGVHVGLPLPVNLKAGAEHGRFAF
jgi:hypothetical protein